MHPYTVCQWHQAMCWTCRRKGMLSRGTWTDLRGGMTHTSWSSVRPSAKVSGQSQAQVQDVQRMDWKQPWESLGWGPEAQHILVFAETLKHWNPTVLGSPKRWSAGWGRKFSPYKPLWFRLPLRLLHSALELPTWGAGPLEVSPEGNHEDVRGLEHLCEDRLRELGLIRQRRL